MIYDSKQDILGFIHRFGKMIEYNVPLSQIKLELNQAHGTIGGLIFLSRLANREFCRTPGSNEASKDHGLERERGNKAEVARCFYDLVMKTNKINVNGENLRKTVLLKRQATSYQSEFCCEHCRFMRTKSVLYPCRHQICRLCNSDKKECPICKEQILIAIPIDQIEIQ